MFQIDLTSSGELCLHMPNGCAVEISATLSGLEFIKKVILDHRRNVQKQVGYIGTLPTQHAIDKFMAKKKVEIAREKADELKNKATKLDINWDSLEINL